MNAPAPETYIVCNFNTGERRYAPDNGKGHNFISVEEADKYMHTEKLDPDHWRIISSKELAIFAQCSAIDRKNLNKNK